MPDGRLHNYELERIVEAARKSIRKWETLTDEEKKTSTVECWELIATTLIEAYVDQHLGHYNHHITEDDVLYARRVAAWRRFDLEIQAWRADDENAAAENLARRAKGQPGAAGVVSAETKARLATKPKAPDKRDRPLLQPLPEDKPKDWPPGTRRGRAWVDDLLRVRRANAVVRPREPGDDKDAAE